MGDYSYSLDEEHYHGDYDTRDEAIAAAIEAVEHERPGARLVWIGHGQERPSFISCVSVTSIIEQASDNALCDGPDCADDGFEVSKEAEREVEVLIRDWAARNKIAVPWYQVAHVEEVTVELGDSAKEGTAP